MGTDSWTSKEACQLAGAEGMDNPTSVRKAIKGFEEIKVDRIVMKIQIKLRNKMP